MDTQDKYNKWFKSMADKYLRDYLYDIEERSENDTTYLIATIKHTSDSEKNIEISSYGKELTLSFWKHHEHHDQSENDDHEDGFIYLSDYIKDIMSDKIIFSAGYRDGKISYAMASYDIDDHLNRKEHKKIIKSWSGKYDRSIEEN